MRSSCQWLVPSESCEEESDHFLSPLASSWLLTILGLPGLAEALPQSLTSSSYDVIPMRISVPRYLFMLGWGPPYSCMNSA